MRHCCYGVNCVPAICTFITPFLIPAIQKMSVVETRLSNFEQSLRANSTEKFTIEEGKRRIDDILTSLKGLHDFTTEEVGDALSTLDWLPSLCAIDSANPTGKQSRAYMQEVAEYVSGKEYGKLFLKISTALEMHITAAKFDEESQPVYNLSVLCSGFFNYCDKSSKLAAEFGENGGVDLMIRFVNILDSYEVGTDTSSAHHTKQDILQKVIGILHNCTRHNSDNRHLYRRANAIAIFESKSRSPDVNIRISSVLVLAHIADEKITERLAPKLDCILLLVELLRRAVLSSQHRVNVYSETSGGSSFSAQELADGLSHLAVNDANKEAIQKCEGIPIILRMLRGDFSDTEVLETFTLIWQLVFVESIKRDELIQDIVEVFRELMSSESYMIRELATYIAWELSDYEMSFPPIAEEPTWEKPPFYLTAPQSEAAKACESCIMISCQHDIQMRAIYIKDKLVQAGYNVWINEYPLRERILVEKTAVVQQAIAVLVCVTEKYKESSSCRSEASYAKKLGKPLIPLLMDSEYQPDGWIEKLLGTNATYHRFCSDDDMDTNIEGLVKDLGDRGRVGPARALGNRLKSAMKIIRTTFGNSGNGDSKTSGSQQDTFRVASERNIRYWSSQRVQIWLKENDLDKVDLATELFQGNQLLQMYGHYRKTPNKFMDTLKSDLQLDDRTVLKFTTALCTLCS